MFGQHLQMAVETMGFQIYLYAQFFKILMFKWNNYLLDVF